MPILFPWKFRQNREGCGLIFRGSRALIEGLADLELSPGIFFRSFRQFLGFELGR
jgi:hypothetical protein